MVVVQNITVRSVASSKELWATFDAGSKNRHVASTKMNSESSRSHLVISVVIETTNKATGAVLKGKVGYLSLKLRTRFSELLAWIAFQFTTMHSS